MLSQRDNNYVSHIGPGTPMGNLMRHYWLPAMLASELPRPDPEQLPASRRVAVLRPQ
jgi:hypothetical protein